MDVIDHDCPDGICTSCGDVCMEAKRIDALDVVRYTCPTCGFSVDFDDSPIKPGEFAPILPPFNPPSSDDDTLIIGSPKWKALNEQ